MWGKFNNQLSAFGQSGISSVVDYEKFNRIAIVHHSSAIEGSTLTLEETTMLLNEGITAKGKPMSEHLMVNDHYKALIYCLKEAEKRTSITVDFLQNLNALVNANTGKVRNTALGICDDTKGDFRLGNVTAGTTYFVNYDKVLKLVTELSAEVESKIKEVKTPEEIFKLSFDAHFNLVTIHPWFDGNGRTSRLLMNYIQAYHSQPLAIVFNEYKPDYYKALVDAREEHDIDIFRKFMVGQCIKYMKAEIEKQKKGGKGFSLMF